MSVGWIEASLVLGALALVLGYHGLLAYRMRTDPERTVFGAAHAVRRKWLARVMEGGDGLLAVQTLRNWVMAASFNASTAMILAIGLLSLMFSADRVPEFLHRLNLLGETADRLTMLKLLLLVADFFVAFFSFSMSIRYHNHAAIMINARAGAPSGDDIETSARYLDRAALHYTIGMRCYYFAVPVALWLFGPIWLAGGTLLLMVVLRVHDHPPRAARGRAAPGPSAQ